MTSEKMKKFMKEVWGKQKGLTLKEMTYFIKLGCKDLPRRYLEKVTKLVLKTGVRRGVFTRSGRRYKILERHRLRLIRELCPRTKRAVSCASGPFDVRHVIRRMRSVQGRGHARGGHAHSARRAGVRRTVCARQRPRNVRRRKGTRKPRLSRPRNGSSTSGWPIYKPRNPDHCPKPIVEVVKPEEQ